MARSLQEGRLKFASLIAVVFLVFHEPFFLDIELYMPLRSVSLLEESFIYGLGFNSQTLMAVFISFK